MKYFFVNFNGFDFAKEEVDNPVKNIYNTMQEAMASDRIIVAWNWKLAGIPITPSYVIVRLVNSNIVVNDAILITPENNVSLIRTK